MSLGPKAQIRQIQKRHIEEILSHGMLMQLVEMDIQIISLKPVNSLEEYFLSLTKDKVYAEARTN
jgi:hypothetical protein